MSGKDFLTKSLFEEEPPKRGSIGYLEKGFKFDKEGRIVDEDGNIYDENYNLIKERPSEGLVMARKQHPDWSDSELKSLAAVYQRIIDKKKRAGKNKNTK